MLAFYNRRIGVRLEDVRSLVNYRRMLVDFAAVRTRAEMCLSFDGRSFEVRHLDPPGFDILEPAPYFKLAAHVMDAERIVPREGDTVCVALTKATDVDPSDALLTLSEIDADEAIFAAAMCLKHGSGGGRVCVVSSMRGEQRLEMNPGYMLTLNRGPSALQLAPDKPTGDDDDDDDDEACLLTVTYFSSATGPI